MPTLSAILTNFAKMPEREVLPLLGLFDTAKVPAHATLLTPGKVCPAVWLVGSGALRAFYQVEEHKRARTVETVSREVNNWLIPPGGLYTAMQSFFQREPTTYYVETLADTQLFALSYPNYQTLMKSHPEVGFKIFEQVIIMADARVKMATCATRRTVCGCSRRRMVR